MSGIKQQDSNPITDAMATTGGSSNGGIKTEQTNGGNYTDFRLRAGSIENLNGAKYHLMRLQSKSKVDPVHDFVHPLRLARKDPRNLGRQQQEEQQQQQDEDDGDGKQQQQQQQDDKKKDETASVAPYGKPAGKNAFQRKTKQGYSGNQEARRLRYEENFPWILEDFEGKNVWVSNYEAAQSDVYCLFVFDVDGFKMVPVNKGYRFTPRNRYATLSLDEAEDRMAKMDKIPRWFMKHMQDSGDGDGATASSSNRRGLRTVDNGRLTRPKREVDDTDELDYDEEFADDEEAPIMEGNEEENKEVEQRIKREQKEITQQATANTNNEDDNDKQEKDLGKEGKRLKRYLRSLEKNMVYESDDEGSNPYISDEEDESVTDEQQQPAQEEAQTSAAATSTTPAAAGTTPKTKKNKNKKQTTDNEGVVVLKLPSSQLSKLGSKRSREEISGSSSSKKMRLGTPPKEQEEGLLTQEDIKQCLLNSPNKRLTTKELVSQLKPKLKLHESNNERLRSLLKQVAKLQDGYLVAK